jgi:hypothetical protein
MSRLTAKPHRLIHTGIPVRRTTTSPQTERLEAYITKHDVVCGPRNERLGHLIVAARKKLLTPAFGQQG